MGQGNNAFNIADDQRILHFVAWRPLADRVMAEFDGAVLVMGRGFGMNRLLNAQTIHWTRTRSWNRGASLSYMNGDERHESTWIGYFLSASWHVGLAESKRRLS